MKLFKKIITLSLVLMTFNSYADGFDAIPSWAFTGAMGLSNVDNMYQDDGQYFLGKIAIEKYLYTSENVDIGFQLGLQSGNSMRLDIPKDSLDLIGGVPIQFSLKPSIDTLFTLKINNVLDDFFLFFKGGAIYQRAQIDRFEINDITKFNPEIEAGIGYLLNDKLNVFLSYQHIFGNNPNFILNEENYTASIQNIPTQQSVFLGVSFLF